MSNLKQRLMVIAAILGTILILIFQQGLYKKEGPILPPVQNQTTTIQTDTPEVISTLPSPLDETIILPNQTIEITFNIPIENRGEFKNRIETFTDYKIELSSDRKTVKIIPTTPFKLGSTYTLFISPETKFDGAKTLNREIIYHFKTIDYKGI